MSTWFPETDLPTLPVVDLVTGRTGSSEEDVTGGDIDGCQIRWDFTKLFRLEIDRRKELCSFLVRMTSKKASDLKDSDAFKLWSRVAKDPGWPDNVMSDPEEDLDEE